MSDEGAISTANDFHEKQVCPTCQAPFRKGEPIRVCAQCGAASHERCWRQSPSCQSYFCRKGGRAAAPEAPAITITRQDTDRLKEDQLLPPTTSYPAGREGRGPRRTSLLAMAALVLAVISAGLFGCVALVLAAVALALIANNSTLKGRWAAVSAILLSIALMGGWAWALWRFPWNVNQSAPIHFRDSPAMLKNVPEPCRGSMRANVVVRTADRGLLSRMLIGSGVIVALDKERALILTNRHVIDPGYKEGAGKEAKPASIQVAFCGQESVPATVEWVHPAGADLALLKCSPRDLDSPAVARLRLPTDAAVGAEVYAVGNPMDLGWTYTKGVISSLREVDVGGQALKVYQTQTPINEGNSGGGLYDAEGRLIGVNTWTQHKSSAEGLSFAIAADEAAEALAPLLEAAAKAPPAPPAPPPPPPPPPAPGVAPP